MCEVLFCSSHAIIPADNAWGRLHRQDRSFRGSHRHRSRRRRINIRRRGGRLTETGSASLSSPPFPAFHGRLWSRRHSSVPRKTRSLTQNRPSTTSIRDLIRRNTVAGIGPVRGQNRGFASPNTHGSSWGTRSTCASDWFSHSDPGLLTRRRTVAGKGARLRHGWPNPLPNRGALRHSRLHGAHVGEVPQRTAAEAPCFLTTPISSMTGRQAVEAHAHQISTDLTTRGVSLMPASPPDATRHELHPTPWTRNLRTPPQRRRRANKDDLGRRRR